MKTVKIEVQSKSARERLIMTLGMAGFRVWQEKEEKDHRQPLTTENKYFVCFEVPDDAVTDGGGK